METLHLFREDESGETYAARDLAHAKELWKTDTGQNPDDSTDWQDVPDDKVITVDCDGEKVTKSAAEWANEMPSAGACFGANY